MKFEQHAIERYSSNRNLSAVPGVKVIKEHNYKWVVDFTLSGDAPKGLIRMYEYNKDSKIRKSNPKTWPIYIAKTGHKWYPNESLTEYLMNKLGEIFGLVMAESDIVVINNQLRFLSKYFLEMGKEELVHGADIFSGYLEDTQFVQDVEEQGKSREMFTMQFVESAVATIFPKHKEYIMHELVRLVVFDALVGNNDRHYYNWGVVRNVIKTSTLRFAPIYDTARGLFWNDDDDKIKRRTKSKNDTKLFLEKYCEKSRPKLGWEGDMNINHFSMIRHISSNEFHITKEELQKLFDVSVLMNMLDFVDRNFSKLMIPERLFIVKECLKYRFYTIKRIIENGKDKG